MNTKLPPKILPIVVKDLATPPNPAGDNKQETGKETPLPGPRATQPIAQAPVAETPVKTNTAPNAERKILKRQSFEIEEKPDSLPVLEAFQEFLDAERKRTRTRMAVVALILLVVSIGTAAVSLIIVQEHSKHLKLMQEQISQFQKESQDINAATKSSLAGFDEEASKLRKDIEVEKKVISEAAEEMKMRAEGQDTTFAKIRETISALEAQNDSIRSDLATIHGGWPTLSTSVESLQKEMAKMRSKNSRETVAQASPRQAHKMETRITMPLVPRGSTNTVTWQIPLPE
jgi:chromosome segregation ATPase